MMIRFLDLTLLLLMAFLLEADLSIEVEVGLPHGDPDQSEQSDGDVWRVNLFPGGWNALSAGSEICAGANMTSLVNCLQPSPPSSAVVVPSQGVSVQRLVNVLDVCTSVSVPCLAGADE